MGKRKWLFILSAAGLLLSAVPNVQAEKAESRHHEKEEWIAEREKWDQQLLELADQYSPETKKEWEAVLSERKQLIDRMGKQGLYKRHHHFRAQRQKEIAEMKEKVKNGEMTEAQMKEKINSFKAKREQFRLKRAQARKQWEAAVRSNDGAKIKELLDTRLQHMKEHNEKMQQVLDSPPAR
ncbi:hypothetical protein [Metabacillus indicus]|uniref:hypothetical protein n=1 Tax=Metabacillus indicus TaxID=246786 RepID=UPI003CE752F2